MECYHYVLYTSLSRYLNALRVLLSRLRLFKAACCTEFLKFVGPIGPKEQKIMRSANNVGNAGPHVRQTFLNDVFTFLTEVRNAGSVVNTGTSSVNSEFVTALKT